MKEAGNARSAAPNADVLASARAVTTGRLRAAGLVALVLFLAPVLVLGAQTTSSQDSTQAGSTQAGSREITIEELFLKSVEFQILREKAASDDFEIKMSALDDLEKKVAGGVAQSDAPQIEFVLEYLAMEGSGRISRESGRQVNNFPEVRRRAANLLGRVGTEESKDALIRVLLIDDEPIVKSEAAYALGVLGMNPNNEVVKALEFAYNREDPTQPDQNFGYAVSLAIEKLAQKTPGGIKDPDAYRLLVKIAQGNYLRTVKMKALQVLDELKSSK